MSERKIAYHPDNTLLAIEVAASMGMLPLLPSEYVPPLHDGEPAVYMVELPTIAEALDSMKLPIEPPKW